MNENADLVEFTTLGGRVIFKNHANGMLSFRRDDGSYSREAMTLKTIQWLITTHETETSLPTGTKLELTKR